MPPRIVSIDITRTNVDVTEGSQTIPVNLHIVSDANFARGLVWFFSPSRNQRAVYDFGGFNDPNGTHLDETYTAQVVIPQSAEPGMWYLDTVSLGDVEGHGIDVGRGSFPGGTADGIEVASAHPDLEKPRLISFDFEPKHVDASENPQVITVTARFADDLSGITWGAFAFSNPSRNGEIGNWWLSELPWSSRVAGNAHDGIYTTTIVIPKGAELGTWNLNYVYAYDATDNSKGWGQWYGEELPAGTPTELVVSPVVQTSATGYTTSAEDSAAQVTVVRGGDPNLSATVHVETASGTAREGTDFGAVSTDLSFAPGEVTKQVAIPLLAATAPVRGSSADDAQRVDATRSGNHNFKVKLSSPRGAILGAVNASTVRLANSQAPPAIQWEADSYTARESQGAVAVTLVRTGLVTDAATVHFATQGASARRATDFRRVSGDVTFEPGARIKTIVIPILQDSIDELTEYFVVNLTAATGASLPRPAVRVKIVDDDPLPTVQWSSPDYSAAESDGFVELTATLLSWKSTRVTVRYGTGDDTATAAADYSTASGEINFVPGGAMAQTVRIPINNDGTAEGGESFKVRLSGGASALIGNNSTATVTITE